MHPPLVDSLVKFFLSWKNEKITRHCNLSTKSMNLGFHWGFQQEGNWTIFHRQTKLHVLEWNFFLRIIFLLLRWPNQIKTFPAQLVNSPLGLSLMNTPDHFFFILQIVNQHLLKDLTERGLWNDTLKNKLVAANGSIQVLFTLVNKWTKQGCVMI